MENKLIVEITAEMVKELRQVTGAGILDCKKMLVETNGDMGKAADKLREKGLAKAAKKADREANEGIIGHYVHAGGRTAALVEVNCETDFVARTAAFEGFVHNVAMQIVAMSPRFVSIESVPEDVIEAEKETYRKQMENENKPPQIVERIVEGKLKKFYQDNCLLEQAFIKDEDKTIGQLVTEMIAQLGENIVIKRFVRYEIGE
ncbi:MAG: translation elongation factor Ts [Anaerolineae bacterium]|nr:translation elongation factor Ts [Anaerolineae bacterium]